MRLCISPSPIEEGHIGCILGESPGPEVTRVFFSHVCNVTAHYFWIRVVVEFNICRGSYMSGFELVEGARGHSKGLSPSLHKYDEEDNPEDDKAEGYFFHL